jgi:hypothetical protein
MRKRPATLLANVYKTATNIRIVQNMHMILTEKIARSRQN